MNFYRTSIPKVGDPGAYTISYDNSGTKEYVSTYTNRWGWGNVANVSDIVIGGGVGEIDGMFSGCYDLNANVTFQQADYLPKRNNLDNLFRNCSNLNKKVILGNGILSYDHMGNNMFCDCVKFNQPVDMRGLSVYDDSVRLQNAFCNCLALDQIVYLPYDLSMLFDTFWRCEKLTKAKIIVNRLDYLYTPFSFCNNLRDIYINARFNTYDNTRSFGLGMSANYNLHLSNRIYEGGANAVNILERLTGITQQNWTVISQDHWYNTGFNIHTYFNETIT